ncbi:hypothetical protein [Pedobacter cryoconitis]|uniref:Uncharacterized protein n=1 Tax=Pedobacter cryoconitis TaxID=188932 RepID=A0A7X0J6Q9_9SPHI|nr:hypothetical protein [Pedobacter cryoconitis]MBB6500681.1 hypothetical protein [Pedobacter cryoconitis]
MKQIYTQPFSFLRIFNTVTSIDLIQSWNKSLFKKELKNALTKTIISFYPKASRSDFHSLYKPVEICYVPVQVQCTMTGFKSITQQLP